MDTYIKRSLLLSLVIIVIFVVIFLVYRLKKYPEYFNIVDNSIVETKVVPKKYGTINVAKLIFSNAFVPNTATILKLTNYTDISKIPPGGDLNTGINKSTNKYTIYIYNPNDTDFVLFGCSVGVKLPTTKSNTNPVSQLIGPKDGTPVEYDGKPINIPPKYQIQFTNTNSFILSRLFIICNNVSEKSLYIYLMNGNKEYGGIILEKLTNHIITLNLLDDITSSA